ncbi:hypothetical protein AHF37_11996 [Paragonimus kellicotti]|nr:hypothetical protein AHF37_11996 [Paragonimus kellicotti]
MDPWNEHGVDHLLTALESDPRGLESVYRLLYGQKLGSLMIPNEVRLIAENEDLEVQSYLFPCVVEELRPPRRIRVGAVQNKIVCPPSSPVAEQVFIS